MIQTPRTLHLSAPQFGAAQKRKPISGLDLLRLSNEFSDATLQINSSTITVGPNANLHCEFGLVPKDGKGPSRYYIFDRINVPRGMSRNHAALTKMGVPAFYHQQYVVDGANTNIRILRNTQGDTLVQGLHTALKTQTHQYKEGNTADDSKASSTLKNFLENVLTQAKTSWDQQQAQRRNDETRARENAPSGITF